MEARGYLTPFVRCLTSVGCMIWVLGYKFTWENVLEVRDMVDERLD